MFVAEMIKEAGALLEKTIFILLNEYFAVSHISDTRRNAELKKDQELQVHQIFQSIQQNPNLTPEPEVTLLTYSAS